MDRSDKANELKKRLAAEKERHRQTRKRLRNERRARRNVDKPSAYRVA